MQLALRQLLSACTVLCLFQNLQHLAPDVNAPLTMSYVGAALLVDVCDVVWSTDASFVLIIVFVLVL